MQIVLCETSIIDSWRVYGEIRTLQERGLTQATEGVAPAGEGSLEAHTDGVVEASPEAGIEAALRVTCPTDFATAWARWLLGIYKINSATPP